MAHSTFENVLAGLWLLATLGGFAFALREALRPPGRGVVRALLFLALVAVFVLLHLGAMLAVLVIDYCENCAGRPLTPRQFAAAGVLLVPPLLLWAAVLLWRRLGHRRRGEPAA